MRADATVNPVVAGFGPLRVSDTPLAEIAAGRARASRIVDEVGFDR